MTEQQDALAERAAIMAEANGWRQDKAERTIAWDRGFGTWQEMWRAGGRGNSETRSGETG